MVWVDPIIGYIHDFPTDPYDYNGCLKAIKTAIRDEIPNANLCVNNDLTSDDHLHCTGSIPAIPFLGKIVLIFRRRVADILVIIEISPQGLSSMAIRTESLVSTLSEEQGIAPGGFRRRYMRFMAGQAGNRPRLRWSAVLVKGRHGLRLSRRNTVEQSHFRMIRKLRNPSRGIGICSVAGCTSQLPVIRAGIISFLFIRRRMHLVAGAAGTGLSGGFAARVLPFGNGDSQVVWRT